MKFTRREYAMGVGLKLSYIRNLRVIKNTEICYKCHKTLTAKDDFFVFCELAYKQLHKPIDCGNFVMTKIPVPYLKYCRSCFKDSFPDFFKKEK